MTEHTTEPTAAPASPAATPGDRPEHRAADAFFDGELYLVEVTGWPRDRIRPDRPIEKAETAPAGARLRVGPVHPHDTRQLPPLSAGTVLDTSTFALRNSGNRTLWAPKRSWKIDLDDGGDRVAGMNSLNLKSMYNDVSQMREALSWNAFRRAKVIAPRHSYARLGIDGRYLGLFALIEEIDKAFVRGHFPGPARGNLYKMYSGSLGPATLEHRVAADGDDSGRQYVGDDPGDQTYRLVKSWSRVPDADGYHDLARFVRVLNGIGLPGGDDRFDTDAFAESMRRIFDVEAFLRWAGVNILTSSWDCYFATPANYFLYNAGRTDEASVVDDPYFTFIPWDYDNTFGIDYFGTAWQDTDLVDWPSGTGAYWAANGSGANRRSRIPLVQNILRNTGFRRYYLDHLEHLLDTSFAPAIVDAAIGLQGDGLWQRVSPSAYLESDSPDGQPFTGRQWTNHEVYLGGSQQQELRRGNAFVLGIHHYLLMRHDRARQQLARLRRADPAGSSGASFGD